MDRVLNIAITVLVLLLLSVPTFAGTTIKINRATVNDLDTNPTLLLHGINFDMESVEIFIGGNALNGCTVTNNLITCPIGGTPDLNAGGTWTVTISAGNAPSKNDSIDVFIPIGLSSQCIPGDFVECYSGDISTKGVGICKSGIRTCSGNGAWGECVGETTPELGETCDDTLDNDCDAAVDEGCQGSNCTSIDDCENGYYCVDGVCCDTECGGTCEACVELKTGMPDGTCSFIDNRDPDDECGEHAVCSAGECGCSSGWGDCNGDPTDGCEANLDTDASNCGSCGNVCTSGSCVAGACSE